MAHTLRQVVEDGQDDPEFFILQVDLINAYNMADREATFKEIERLFPECLSWVMTCYGVEAELVFGDTVICKGTPWPLSCSPSISSLLLR